jgi:septal ring factor EnvC (AmiA/AmiB activator)
MSRNGDEDNATLRFDDKSNANNSEENSKMKASTDAKLEDLMKKLEKLTTEDNKLRRKVKAKRTKGGPFSSKEEDSSYEEEDSKKGKKGRNNRNKPSYNSMSFNYDNMHSTTAYTFIPIGKAPYFDGTCYNQWKHCMKNYLYSISPDVWCL